MSDHQYIRITKEGRVILRGSRLDVWNVVATWQQNDESITQTASYLKRTVAEVQACLDYYAEHRDEIDRQLRERDEANDQAQGGPDFLRMLQNTEGLVLPEGIAKLSPSLERPLTMTGDYERGRQTERAEIAAELRAMRMPHPNSALSRDDRQWNAAIDAVLSYLSSREPGIKS